MIRANVTITGTISFVALLALTACTENPTAPQRHLAASVASLSGCGVEQLRGAPTRITLPSETVSDTGRAPVPIRGVTVYADFPHQWFGTNSAM